MHNEVKGRGGISSLRSKTRIGSETGKKNKGTNQEETNLVE